MAQESGSDIIQTLGFDVTKAISGLAALDKRLEDFEQRLVSIGSAMDLFNGVGQAATGVLKTMTEATLGAVRAFQDLNSSRTAAFGANFAKSLQQEAQALSNYSKAAQKAEASNDAEERARQNEMWAILGGQKVAPRIKPPDLGDYMQAVRGQLDELPHTASRSVKRAFESTVLATAEAAQKAGLTIEQTTKIGKNWEATYTGAANAVANKFAAANAVLEQTRNRVQEVTVDLKTMVRIVTTQAIVRALSALRDALRASVGSAVQFKRELAEIATIAPDETIASLGRQIEGLSNQYNIDLDTTAAAYYETLSNQVGDTATSLEFLGTAAKFSKTAVTSMDDSVLLLTGALNAFGKSADQADVIAGQFFKTIELGRVRGKEMVNSFGQVLPSAEELGVELTELQAALSTITVGGQNAARASTEIRALLTAFVKPSETAAKAMQSLGFETGQEIIAAYGLQGAVRAMREEMGGGADVMGKLFVNVRALNAAFRLTSEDGAAKYRDILQVLEDVDRDFLDKKYEIVVETDVERVTGQLNQLSNYFTSEFGQGVLTAADWMFYLVGGAESITRVMSAMAVPLGSVVTLLGAYGAKLAYAAARQKLLSASVDTSTQSLTRMGMAINGVGLALAGITIGQLVYDSFFKAMTQGYDTILDTVKRLETAEVRRIQERLDKEQRLLTKLLQAESARVTEARKLYFKDVKNARDALEARTESFKDSMQSMLGFHRDVVSQLKSHEANAYKEIEESRKRQLQNMKSLEDKLFDQQTDRLDERHKYYKVMDRAQKAMEVGAGKLAKATTPEDRNAADDEFRRAEAYIDQAYALGKQLDNRGMMAQSENLLTALINRKNAAEKRYQETQRQVGKDRAADAKAAQQDVWELEGLMKKAEDATKTLNDKSATESAKQDAQKTLDEVTKRFEQISTQGLHLPISKLFALEDLKPEVERHLASIELQNLHAAPAALAALRGEMEQLFGQRKDPVMDLTEKITEDRINTAGDLATHLKKIKDSEPDRAKLVRDFEEAKEAIKGTAVSVGEVVRKLGSMPETVGFADEIGQTYEMVDQTAVAYNKLVKAIRAAGESETLGADQLNHINQLKQEFLDQASWLEEWTTYGAAIKGIGDAISELTRREQALQEVQNSPVNTERFKQEAEQRRLLQQLLQQTHPDVLEQNSQKVKQNTNETQAALQSGVSPAQGIAQAMADAAASAGMLAATLNILPSPSIGTQYAANGGLMRRSHVNRIATYFASGGFASRGADTIPTMLSPNEYVVNPQSTRRFFSQLQAINAGVQPVYRSDGGSVTNIGDINVTVKGGDSSRQTARQIASELRRELRRGTSRL